MELSLSGKMEGYFELKTPMCLQQTEHGDPVPLPQGTRFGVSVHVGVWW